MNILLVSKGWQFSGAANYLCLLAEHTADRWNLHCCVPKVNSYVGNRMFQAGVSIHSTDAIDNIIKSESIDLVFSNTLMSRIGAKAAMEAGVPHVWYVHELLSKDPDTANMDLMELYSYIGSTGRAIAISNAVKEELQCYGNCPDVTVIRNGIEITPRPENRQMEPIVMNVGGICRRKDQMTYLRAAALVLKEIPEARFVSYGGTWDAPYYMEMVRERRKLKIPRSSFSFRSQIVPPDYSQAKIFCTTPVGEAFGQIILEAMVAGLPVVATRAGGPQEIIEEGETGWTAEPGDYKEIASHIINLLAYPKSCERMGDLGYDRAKMHFNYTDYLKKMIAFIEGTA